MKLRPKLVLNYMWPLDQAFVESLSKDEEPLYPLCGLTVQSANTWLLSQPDPVRVIHRNRMLFIGTYVRVPIS